jgi:hypothetical protein
MIEYSCFWIKIERFPVWQEKLNAADQKSLVIALGNYTFCSLEVLPKILALTIFAAVHTMMVNRRRGSIR